MCGIAFWSKARRNSDIADSTLLAAALLRQIESRGHMAAGAAWHDPTNAVWWQKAPTSGSVLAKSLAVPADAPVGMLHTRFATKGSPSQNGNNHPILRPGIVMVHNGVIRNDDAVFATLKVDRLHEVDSEAIAASLMASGTLDERLGALHGAAAVIWMDVDSDEGGNSPTIHAARCSSSPLVLGQTKAGDTIAASTQAHLIAATRACGITLVWVHEMTEWQYVEVRHGKVLTMRDLERPAWSTASTYVAPDWRGGLKVYGRTGTTPVTPLPPRTDTLPSTEQAMARWAYEQKQLYDDGMFDDPWEDEDGFATDTLHRDPAVDDLIDPWEEDVFDEEDEDALRQWFIDAAMRDGQIAEGSVDG